LQVRTSAGLEGRSCIRGKIFSSLTDVNEIIQPVKLPFQGAGMNRNRLAPGRCPRAGLNKAFSLAQHFSIESGNNPFWMFGLKGQINIAPRQRPGDADLGIFCALKGQLICYLIREFLL
jgi:hypothetical protein